MVTGVKRIRSKVIRVASFNAKSWSQLQTLAAICSSNRQAKPHAQQHAVTQFLFPVALINARGDSEQHKKEMEVESGNKSPGVLSRQTILATFAHWINRKRQGFLSLAGLTTAQLGVSAIHHGTLREYRDLAVTAYTSAIDNDYLFWRPSRTIMPL